MANDVKALVITGVGLNCEKETAAAFTSSGASATLIHINDLLSGKATMEPYSAGGPRSQRFRRLP